MGDIPMGSPRSFLAFLELTDGWERRPLNKSTINNYSLERAMMKIGSYKNELWTGGTAFLRRIRKDPSEEVDLRVT